MSGWQKVRRKGAAPANRANSSGIPQVDEEELTSFYIANLPGDSFRKELWKPCALLGNLADIYIAGRRNAVGSFFAFVKYREVKDQADIDRIAGGLKEIDCRGRRLIANYAKHSKPKAKVTPVQPKPIAPKVFKAAHKGPRSFVDVAKGKGNESRAATVSLENVPEMQKWADKTVLIGEVRNFDTICNFPTLMELEGFNIQETKYIGGMQVAVKFKSERAAEVFKANKAIWLKWFVWVEFFGKARVDRGRVAWVKIAGIPLLAWDEANFAAIAGLLD